MALPGLSLPGLGLQTSSSSAPPPTTQTSRLEELAPRSEWRFEVAFTKSYRIRLTRGHAELFGTELAPNTTYTFTGYKGAVFTWHGCTLEITGDAESEYVGSETEYMVEWLNVHGMLETIRDESPEGPRVLIVGPDNVGKSSLVKCLGAWATKVGRTTTLVNLDPREGLLSVPGSLTAVTLGSVMDVEDGFGSAPISGPTAVPVKTPLVYSYPFSAPEERSAMFKAITTRVALAVTSKLEEDGGAKSSGIIIDTPGSFNQPKNTYEIVSHIISEFSVNVVLTLGSERLYNDLQRRFSAPRGADEVVTVLRISQPGGAVERDAAFMKAVRTQQTKSYFFGDSKTGLNPHGQWWEWKDLSVYRALSAESSAASSSFMAYSEDDAPEAKREMAFEKVQLDVGMTNSMLAIKFCTGNSDEETIRDSCVMGFVYVAEVDETRKRVRFLAPHPSRWGDRAIVCGSWPEAVPDLVT